MPHIKDFKHPIKGVAHMYTEEEQKQGVAVLSKFTFSNKIDPFYNLRLSDGYMYMYDGEYVSLTVNGTLMMSDTAMERKTNTDFDKNAKGDVLIAGLGVGMILPNLIASDKVKSITVIEKYQDVIDLVEPKFKCDKLKVVCADCFEYEPKQNYDTIYLDIWHNISSENVDEINNLEEKYAWFLNKDGYLNSWVKDIVIAMKGVEEGTHCEYCMQFEDECTCEICDECGERNAYYGRDDICLNCNCEDCEQPIDDCTCCD